MFEIKKAVREAMPILAAFWGPSFSGKTRSALEFARGLVGPKGRILLIDTENKRALTHAEEVGGWDHLDFQPPFTPERYIEAYNTGQKNGPYDAVIIDSGSHVWEGEGGVIDMADRDGGKGIGRWKSPKMSYKRMVNHLLRSPTHVIFCLRSKEAIEQKGSGQNMVIKKTGMVPICEKNFIYEMTVSFLIGPDHKPLVKDTEHFACSPIVPRIKMPVEGAYKAGDMISQGMGKAVAEWVSGGVKWDVALAALQQVARDVSTLGTESLEKHWGHISKADRKALESILDDLKETAAQADDDAKTYEQAEAEKAAETTESLDDDAPVNQNTDDKPIDDVSRETPDEKPADEPKPPKEDKKAKEPAKKKVDEKPDEQQSAPSDDAPEVKFLILDKMGTTLDCGSIEAWKDKLLVGIPKMTRIDALEALKKRHGTIFTNLRHTHPEAVEMVEEAIDAAIAFINSDL